MDVYYSIVKTYKGIFKKKHSGNIHILILPTKKDQFSTFIIIGKLKDLNNTYALQFVGSGHTDHLDDFLDKYNSKGFINLEKIPCSFLKKDKTYFYKLKGKGKYILSNFIIENKPEFHFNKSELFFLKGKFNFTNDENIIDKQLKMIALKKSSLLTSILNKFKKKE